MVQLFSADAELFALSELAELILSQPLLGSTVKVDGPESDPYALLTVINLMEHRDKTPIQQIVKYLKDKCPVQHQQQLHTVLLDTTRTRDAALVLSERLINMPVQIIPPMFRMLTEELGWAVEDVRFRFLSPGMVVLSPCSIYISSHIPRRMSPTILNIT